MDQLTPTPIFELEEGVVIRVTAGALAKSFTSRRAAEFPETPSVLLLRSEGRGHKRYSLCEEDVVTGGHQLKGPRVRGRHLFVPSDLKAGERVIVRWVDTRSALATRYDG